VTVPFDLLPDTDIIENICENEKDQERLKGRPSLTRRAGRVGPAVHSPAGSLASAAA
jgi:hypothetical protein